jgi:iron complex outermembrane recepter protein
MTRDAPAACSAGEQGTTEIREDAMQRLMLYLLVIAALMITTAASAKAEEGKTAPVAALASGGEQTPYVLTGITVTATKTDVPANQSPFTTYTVDRKNIESQPDYFRGNFGPLIQDLPGVMVQETTFKSQPWITLRGTGDFNARTLYMIDGIPVGSSQGFTNAIYRDDIERVDVVMGPSSALYGANASGGVVNIITRQGTPGMGATVSYSYGTFNTNRPRASFGEVVSKGGNKFNYYFSYSGDYSDGYENIPVDNALRIYSKASNFLSTATPESAGYSDNHLTGKAGWTGPNGASLVVAYNYLNQRIKGGQPNLIPLDNGDTGVGHVRFQLPYADFGKVTFTGGYQDWDRPAKTNTGISLSGRTLRYNYAPNYSQDSRVTRYPLELQNDLYLGKNNVLTTGMYFVRERIASESDIWTTGAFKSASSYTQEQKALYVQDQAFFFDKRLSLLAGVRYDQWKTYDIYDSSSTNKNPAGFDDSTTTYRGGAKFQIDGHLAVKSSVGTAYYPGLPTWYFQNVNTGTTWREPNPNMKPEKTWMVDLGLEGDYPSTGTKFSITGYSGIIRDTVSGRYDPHPTLPGVSIIRYSNVGRVEIYGVETLIDQKIMEHLSAFLSLTFNHSSIVRDPVNQGNQLAFSPSFLGSAGVRYNNPSLLNGTLTVRRTTSQFYDNENTRLPFYHTSPYYSFDTKVWRDWKLTGKLTLKTALSVENIFDKNYSPVFIYTNPGRIITGLTALNYKF